MAITIWTRPARWAAAWACALGALVGCGGGGGGGDSGSTISGTYQLDGLAELGVAGSIRAELPQGVEGTPRCSLVSGSVPPGMVFGTDCSLAGTPSQIGVFTSQLNFTVSGHPGSATVNVQMVIGGPVLQQTGPLTETLQLLTVLPPSDVVGVFGQSMYSPLAGDVITYAVASGNLPTGLTLDPATGKLSGTPVVLGTFEAQLGATLRRNGQDYPLNTVFFAKTVVAPFGNLTYNATCCDLNYGVVPMQTPAPVFFPALPAGATARFESTAALPAGLALDPATGIISGRSAMPGTYPVSVRATDHHRRRRGLHDRWTWTGNSLALERPGRAAALRRHRHLRRAARSSSLSRRSRFAAAVQRLPLPGLNTVCNMPPGTVFGGRGGRCIPLCADRPPHHRCDRTRSWVSRGSGQRGGQRHRAGKRAGAGHAGDVRAAGDDHPRRRHHRHAAGLDAAGAVGQSPDFSRLIIAAPVSSSSWVSSRITRAVRSSMRACWPIIASAWRWTRSSSLIIEVSAAQTLSVTPIVRRPDQAALRRVAAARGARVVAVAGGFNASMRRLLASMKRNASSMAPTAWSAAALAASASAASSASASSAW